MMVVSSTAINCGTAPSSHLFRPNLYNATLKKILQLVCFIFVQGYGIQFLNQFPSSIAFAKRCFSDVTKLDRKNMRNRLA